MEYHTLNGTGRPAIRKYEEIVPTFPYDGVVLGVTPSPSAQENFSANNEKPFNLKAYGIFDIEHITLPGDVNRVPLEIYLPPVVTLRYDENGQAVTPRVMQPTLDPRGYVLSPPLLLTTLEAARLITNDDCASCISAIRVRVSDIERLTPATQRKIETIASEITRLTGLDVDIMVGSSPTRVLVHIPGTGYVEEQWIQKNVTYTYKKKVQTGHLLLLSTLLGIGGLFVLDLAWAEVTARRHTIALQKALGWRSTSIFRQVSGQILLVGVVAALLGMLISVGLIQLLSQESFSASWLISIPLSVIGLSLFGGFYPAWLAARVVPLVGLRSGNIRTSRTGAARPGYNLWGYAWRGLARRWSRTALGGLTAMLSAVLLVLMLAVTVDRQGAMSGTLLGEFILVRIEGYHYAIVGLGFFLAALSLANSLLAGVLERRREIGVLKAIGWHTSSVIQLFTMEGVLLGALGGLLGTAIGLGVFMLLYEAASLSLVWVGLIGVLVPVIIGALAALYPARVAANVPPSEAIRYE